MYNSRVKNRKVKRLLQKIFSITKFKTANFSTTQKIILLAIILGIISFFLPWLKIQQEDNISIFLGFNSITYFSNIIILFIFLILLYLLFSFNAKEKINILFGIPIKNSLFMILGNILIILFSINSIFTINGLKIFYSNINYGKGIIILLISGIIGLLASFNLNDKKSEKIIISENENKKNIYDEKNMKLPI